MMKNLLVHYLQQNHQNHHHPHHQIVLHLQENHLLVKNQIK